MNDLWREFLYPLGFISSFAFGSRMLVQWLNSERKKESTVTPLFWKLSLCGNLTLMLHAFIQVQFHVAIVQVCNAVISWRNLNLMQRQDKQFSLKATMQILLCAIGIATLLFTVQGTLLIGGEEVWFRMPVTPWNSSSTPTSFGWNLFGFIGLSLFSSRFWIQWWYAEKQKRSFFNPTFWWMSLCGETICLIHFFHIHDPVNYLGPLFGLVPYVRNLMLIYLKPVKSSLNNEKLHEPTLTQNT